MTTTLHDRLGMAMGKNRSDQKTNDQKRMVKQICPYGCFQK